MDTPPTCLDDRLVAALVGSTTPVVVAYLFGSQAAGRTWAESDVDVAVLFDEPDACRRLDMSLELAEELSSALGNLPVDVVCLDEQRNGLAHEVLRTGRCLLARDEKRRARFEAETCIHDFDRAPTQRLCRDYLLRRVREGRMLERSPAMVDRHTVERLIAYIQEMLNRLSVQRGKSFEEFESDVISVDASLRQLQTMLEAVSDIATHVVAGANLGTPTDRPHALELLTRNGILPPELGGRLIQAVRMRNLLVHFYPGVDLRKVYDVIQNDLPDIGAFCGDIVRYLDVNDGAIA